jgi:hypothetical protein
MSKPVALRVPAQPVVPTATGFGIAGQALGRLADSGSGATPPVRTRATE